MFLERIVLTEGTIMKILIDMLNVYFKYLSIYFIVMLYIYICHMNFARAFMKYRQDWLIYWLVDLWSWDSNLGP